MYKGDWGKVNQAIGANVVYVLNLKTLRVTAPLQHNCTAEYHKKKKKNYMMRRKKKKKQSQLFSFNLNLDS